MWVDDYDAAMQPVDAHCGHLSDPAPYITCPAGAVLGATSSMGAAARFYERLCATNFHDMVFTLLRVEPTAENVGRCAPQFTTLRMKLQLGICPFPVLGLWGKNTMPHAVTMAFTGIYPLLVPSEE